MSFESRETSLQLAAPVELYIFQVNGNTHRFATSAKDYLYLSNVYTAVPIVRPEIEETSEIPRSNLDLEVPGNFEITNYYRTYPPSDVIWLTILRIHRGDTEAVPWWSGRVLNCKWEGERAKLTCENIFTSLRRQGLQRLYQVTCPYRLYDPNTCKAVESDFEAEAVIDNVDGLVIEAGEFGLFSAGRLAGGYLEWEITASHKEKRGIKSHDGILIEITHPIENLTPGIHVRVLPACLHNVVDCDGYFNNLDNHGGFPFIPRKNPFGGNSVF